MILALEHDVTVALITAGTTVLVATLPLWIRQHYAQKALHDGQVETRAKVEEATNIAREVRSLVNGVDEHDTASIESLRTEMQAGFARLEAQSERVEPPQTPTRKRPERR